MLELVNTFQDTTKKYSNWLEAMLDMWNFRDEIGKFILYADSHKRLMLTHKAVFAFQHESDHSDSDQSNFISKFKADTLINFFVLKERVYKRQPAFWIQSARKTCMALLFATTRVVKFMKINCMT